MHRLLRSELARLLNVSQSALERATRRGETCGGYPVAKWALRRGRQVLYEIPDEVVEELKEPDGRYLKQQSRVIRTFMRDT